MSSLPIGVGFLLGVWMCLLGSVDAKNQKTAMFLQGYRSKGRAFALKKYGSLIECGAAFQRYDFIFGGYDFNTQTGQCRLVFKNDECGGLMPVKDSRWVHINMMPEECAIEDGRGSAAGLGKQQDKFSYNSNKLNEYYRQSTTFTCTAGVVAYSVALGQGLPTGVVQNQGFVSNLEACTLTTTCTGVNYYILTDISTILTSVVTSISSDTNYIYFRKVCFTGAVNFQVVTTTTTTTTVAPSAAPNSMNGLIGDSGQCPDPFQRFANSSLAGGLLVTGLIAASTTEDICKARCLNSAMCVAIDFNSDTKQCFQHTTLAGTFSSGTVISVVHFRKINCGVSRCFQQTVTGSTIPSTSDIQNILSPNTLTGITTADCLTGLCFTEWTFDQTNILALTESISRGCSGVDAIPSLGCNTFNGSVSTIQTTRCVCLGDRCNSYDVFTQDELIGFYPLDNSGADLSGFYRDATANSLTFDQADAKKNWSAVFDGSTSYFQINTYTSIQIGNVNVLNTTITGNQATAGFAVALWLKRTSTTGTETIISNGNFGTAPIEIISTVTDGTTQTIISSFRMRNTAAGTSFTLVGTLTGLNLNAWYFIAIELNSNAGASPTLNMNLFAGQTLITEITSTTTGTSVTTINTPIRVTFAPLCIGKQFTGGVPGMFFTGKMDDIRLFNRGNMAANAYQSMMDQSK